MTSFDPRKVKDAVNHPEGYTRQLSGVEFTEHYNFNIGNAMKHLWRAGLKDNEIEDLKEAAWYVKREIERITSENHNKQ